MREAMRPGTAFTRRRFLAGLGSATAAAAFLAACGDSDDEPEATPTSTGTPDATTATATSEATATATEAAGGFTFTDGRGVTVTLDKQPERVVAYHAPAAALWHLGITPVGVFGGALPEESPNLADIDVTGIEDVGHVYGEIDLEKLVLLKPDLIVTAFSPVQGELTWGFADLDVQAQVQEIAPIVAINGIEDPTDVIASFEELAVAMGVEVDTPEYADARAGFDQAVEDFQAAVAEKEGLTAVALSNFGGEVYFAKPELAPALRQLNQWGLQFVDVQAGEGEFWEIVSFEQVNKYPADLLLFDTSPEVGLDELAERPAWQALPAVAADQIAPWDKLENWSYAAYAADIEAITEVIQRSDPDVVA
ncbi:MAG: ABC transporter substrate-binding protein [Dehalococcoidia bacterium]|nr:ABC transporter substrate-binding protein [Dehalococcoidia bacterium]